MEGEGGGGQAQGGLWIMNECRYKSTKMPDLSAPTLLMLAKITSSVAAGEFRKYKINIHELISGS